MRKISADYILHASGELIKEGTLLIDYQGIIQDVLTYRIEDTEVFQGLLCPGFINVHCHLELSYTKGRIPEKTGLPNFIKHLQEIRNQVSDEEKQATMSSWDQYMFEQGIVAVGDICNGIDSISTKKNSEIIYHSFIELFGFNTAYAQSIFDQGLENKKVFNQACLSSSITPHAPYSTSYALMQLISQNQEGFPISIHNQENEAENELFRTKSGVFLDMLHHFGVNTDDFKATQTSSIQSYLTYFNQKKTLLLVHNTFSSLEDVTFAQHMHPALFWCICPLANLYIENKLPPIDFLRRAKSSICIGTDSLASNHTLSIWEELKTIHRHFPDISIQETLRWATINGAKALQLDTLYGSIEKGKKPGLNLIQNIVEKNGRLYISDETRFEKIL